MHSSDIYLKVEVLPGGHITRTAKEACILADKLNINLELDFNGVNLWAYPGDIMQLNTRIRTIVDSYNMGINKLYASQSEL